MQYPSMNLIYAAECTKELKMMHKKGAAAILILGVILILIIIGLGINRAGRECSSSDDCEDGNYCGSDFKCHKFPVIIKEVPGNSLFWPSVILGIAIIAGAFILRKKKPKIAQ